MKKNCRILRKICRSLLAAMLCLAVLCLLPLTVHAAAPVFDETVSYTMLSTIAGEYIEVPYKLSFYTTDTTLVVQYNQSG